jgi:gamma-glutamyltranspeptidase / glutathione hydrolase
MAPIGRLAFLALLGLAWPGHPLAVSPPPVQGQRGMVVSDQALATAAGVEILRRGGNAVDAAVATAYAQAVVNPCCGNLGGGGFMTIRMADGRSSFIDFRETAPSAATADMYLDKDGKPIQGVSLTGWRAVGVPGTTRGLELALERFGRLQRPTVMERAIALARDGYVLGPADTAILASGAASFAASPALARIFLKDGRNLEPGDRLVQPDLAATLEAIAQQGPDALYRGPRAQAIVDASKAGGGILALSDLETYRAIERTPLTCSYRGYEILSAPPPSSGGAAVCEILNILEGYPLGYLGPGSADATHLMVEAMRHTFFDRNGALGDPAFVKNPVDRLVSKPYAGRIRQAIDRVVATPSSALAPGTAPHEGGDTTHISVVDDSGNAVSLTYSLNTFFGAKVMAPGTGVILNDTMDDFTTAPNAPNLFGLVQGPANAIAPGKRPLSSMSPTIIIHGGKPFLVLGSPGGPRIISSVVQAIINVIDHGMSLQEAVDAPRVHHQWLPDILYAEPFALSADVVRDLALRGHRVVVQKPWSSGEAIMSGDARSAGETLPSFGDDTVRTWQAAPGSWFGSSDNRRPAGAAMAE